MGEALATQLEALTGLPGASGREEAVASYVRSALERAGIEFRTDPLGNVIAASDRPRVLVTAHMDQVGFIVSRIGRSNVHCLPVGDPEVESGQVARVRVLTRERELAGQLRQGRGRTVVQLDGSEPSDASVGDRVLFAPRFAVNGDSVTAVALDDRVGCLVALEAARRRPPDSEVGYAWTVREESEFAGVLAVTRELRPGCVVSLDVTPTEAGAGESRLKIGAGPAITLLDGGMVAHEPLVRAFDEVAGRLGIGWQPEVVAAGVSEAGRAQRILGIPSLALLVPVTGMHSAKERASLRDIGQATELLVHTLSELRG